MSSFAEPGAVHERASAHSLGVLRIWVFGTWAALILFDPLTRLGAVAGAVYRPFGALTILPGWVTEAMLTTAGLAGLKVLLLLVCGAATVGLASRVTVPLAALAVAGYDALDKALGGHVGHSELPLLVAGFVLAFTPCGDAVALWPRGRHRSNPTAYRFPLVAVLFLTAVTYAFVGGYRLAHGTPAVFTSEALPEWLVDWNLAQPDPLRTLGIQVATHPLGAALLRASFPFITLLEVTAPLAVIWRGYRLAFVPAMLAVHLAIWVLMRISFLHEMLLLLVFIDSRHWSAVARRGAEAPVVFFDGVCGLCNRFVDFLLPRDRERRLRFAPLQGTTAEATLGHVVTSSLATIVYREDGEVVERSRAVLRILGRLGGPWSLLTLAGLVPRPVRDLMYDGVAKVRYRWFGKLDACRLPTPEQRAVFLP